MNDDVTQCWSFARQKLRLTDAEFWRLTPREFKILAEGWADDQRAEDRRAATVCMVLANCNRDPGKKPEPFTIDDFMPQRGESQRREQTWEEQVAIFGAFAAAQKAAT